jgi:MYXO-CTERM domain-containing protein
VLVSSLSQARPAQAYVHAVSDAGAPLFWPTSCETVTIYLNGFTGLTSDQVVEAVAAAARTWSPEAVTCPSGDGGVGHPYFEIIPSLASGGTAPGIANDGKNSIIFQTSDWDGPSDGLAYTSHFSDSAGRILDTDIAINASNPGGSGVWADLDPGSPSSEHGIPRFDLQTALTHEFGHFLGLAHTCIGGSGSDEGSDQSPTDDQGLPVPACEPLTAANEQAQQAVMWYEIDNDSVTKRALAPDDVRGVCGLFPPGQSPATCSANLPDDGCGCAAAGGPGGSHAAAPTLALALGTALLLRRRRRR